MVLNNHLYSLYYHKRKRETILTLFDKFNIIHDDFNQRDNELNNINQIYENSFLNLFPENHNVIQNLIQCLDNDNLDIEFLSFKIMSIFFEHNELSIKNLPNIFNTFIDSMIFIEIVIHIHILLLNLYFFDNKLLSKLIKLEINENMTNHNKGNIYLLLIEVLMNTSHLFQKKYKDSELVSDKTIVEYIENNKRDISKILNFNLDTTIETLFENIDNGEEVEKNNKKIMKISMQNIFKEFQTNILDFIKIFINILEKKQIFIPEEEKTNIFILISTVFNYNIVKLD